VQLPAWNEALGLPRPWDQQWSLRLQQIVAYESDLLEYGDLFDGSPVVEAKVKELKAAALEELKTIDDMGGAVAAVENSYMKRRLVESNSERLTAIEAGEQIVVGVNKYVEAEASPLTATDDAIMTVDASAESAKISALEQWRGTRDAAAVADALAALTAAAKNGDNIMEPSIACAHAGVTTGEWSGVLRDVFGEYRAPTGVGGSGSVSGESIQRIQGRVADLEDVLGTRLKMLVGKPGLDGHSNGAEQIAVRARDAGIEVVYEGIRLTPAEIVAAAGQEDVHVVGLSILSGSHITLVADIVKQMAEAGLSDVPVVVGGIIPPEDEKTLLASGVAAVYTPKDFDINKILDNIVDIVEGVHKRAA
jgi:(2R)-ethylmalonyl-CoA mutase